MVHTCGYFESLRRYRKSCCFSFSSYQVAKEKQREEQVKVDYCNRWSTRFLTLKNGNNYTDELLGKYVKICRDHYYQLREYYKNQENKP